MSMPRTPEERIAWWHGRCDELTEERDQIVEKFKQLLNGEVTTLAAAEWLRSGHDVRGLKLNQPDCRDDW